MTKSFHDELIDLLEKQGPLSAPQLEAILGWTKNRTYQVLTRARMKYPKQCIRISGYIPHPNKGPAVCLYVAQAGADAPKPSVLSRDELRRRKNEYQTKARTETKTFGPRGCERVVIPFELRPIKNSTVNHKRFPYIATELAPSIRPGAMDAATKPSGGYIEQARREAARVAALPFVPTRKRAC
jgi:hypothetical protein